MQEWINSGGLKLSTLQTKIPSYGTVQGVKFTDSGFYHPKQ